RTLLPIRKGKMTMTADCSSRTAFSQTLQLTGLLLVSALMSSSGSYAQRTKENPLAPKPPVAAAPKPGQTVKTAPHELTASDAEAFLDGVMPLQLAREDIAGAVISIVKDGKVLFAKGYGYSDVEKKTLCRQTTHFSVPGPFRSSSPGLR